MDNVRLLKENEIECRVGTTTSKGFSILLYKNARVDMQILDELFGCLNWQREHKEVKGNLYCGISVWDEKKSQWVTKWDCGVESFSEKEKGESSDSFKRAGFNWGIGRELYTAPFIWINDLVKANDKGKYEPSINMGKVYVSYIDYDITTREIVKLEIKYNTDVIFSFNMGNEKKAPKTQPKQEQVEVVVKKATPPKAVEPKADQVKEQPKEEPKADSNGTLTYEKASQVIVKGKKLKDLTEDNLKWLIEKYYVEDVRKAAQVVLEHDYIYPKMAEEIEQQMAIDDVDTSDVPF